MNESAVLQIAATVAVPVLAAGWAIARYELGRYAKAHPTSPAVKTAQEVITEAKALAPIVGLTLPKAAGFISGFLAARGHVVPAQAIVATVQAVEKQADADVAAVVPAQPKPAATQYAAQPIEPTPAPVQAPTPAAPPL